MRSYQKDFLERMNKAYYWAVQRGARLNQAVTFAQAALESDWGRSLLAREYGNLFGIKAGTWNGKVVILSTTEYVQGKPILCKARFRWYDSWQLCIYDYYDIIASRWWFEEALNHIDNADEFLRCLLPQPGKPGWATDPAYFNKVKSVGLHIQALGGPAWNSKPY